MADSCRPVSRHGRYNASGPSSVQYTSDTPAYGTMDYTPSDEMYSVNAPPARPERPKTSNGRRSRGDIPPRPSSRRSRQVVRPDPDEESYGRPVSRVGFSPEAEYRYSHDEFSRQISLEGEKRIPNSPNNSPDPGGHFSPNMGASPAQRDMLRDNQHPERVDRLIVSPSSPNPRAFRQSPQRYRQSPQGYRQSPQGYRQSPQGYRQSPQSHTQQFVRPSSRDTMNVSPIHRDENQISEDDLHLQSSNLQGNGEMDMHEGDRYQQRFRESPSYGTSPYGTSPYGTSPQNHEGMYDNTSPREQHTTYRRVPPSQRPKSARPKTGRKKSARVRSRYEEQETSQPQHCDTTSILNVGDPYGRPSSSLSPYKPLPAIGLVTPRNTAGSETGAHHESIQNHVDNVTMETQRLAIDRENQFHPADNDYDTFSAEDIQGARSTHSDMYTGAGIQNVDMLTNLPQHLSEEIYEQSVRNIERQMSEGELMVDSATRNVHSDDGGGGGVIDSENSGKQGSDDENRIQSSDPKPLGILHALPDEPGTEEGRVLLAIKLPDGKRIQRYFRPAETLATVMHFAENASLTELNDYWVACNAPKLTFVDLTQSIADAQIQDRTVLYLEEKD